MATRTGKVILAKGIKLDKNYKNILDYSEQSMVSLVTSKAIGTYTNCSFFRPGENILDIGTAYGTALQANYIAFQNPDYNNKWFFGFIDEVEYVSNGTTRIHFTIDECATWFSYWDPHKCFVVREHTNDDTVGSNLVPEGLETGEYVINGSNKISATSSIYYVINADKAPSTGTSPDTSTYLSTNVGGIPMSGGLFLFYNMPTLTNAFLTYSRMDGGLDHIKNVYTVDRVLCFKGEDQDYVEGTYDEDEYAYYKYTGSSTPTTRSMTITAPTTLNGYTPRNRKLLSSPYQYMILSNNNGSSNELKFEYFSNRNAIVIESKGLPCVGGSIFAYPKNYRGAEYNYNEGIVGGKFPTLSWSGDAYTNWLTQNAVNIRNTVMGDVATTVGGVAMGTLAGGVAGATLAAASIVSGIKSAHELMQEKQEHKKIANSFGGNINGGDVITAEKINNIYAWNMSITAEFAAIIDSYFDLYGYKTLKVKVPNQTGRQTWNYVQIGEGESIGYSNNNNTASVPSQSMDIINNVYQRGVTIWHSHDNLGNYNLSNNITS